MTTTITDVVAQFFFAELIFFGLLGVFKLMADLSTRFSSRTMVFIRLVIGLVVLGTFSLYPMLFWISAEKYDTPAGNAVFFVTLIVTGALYWLVWKRPENYKGKRGRTDF